MSAPRRTPPVLVAFSGLPGTGKTVVAQELATRLGAAYLRIDVIEQAMREQGGEPVGPGGYAVANAVAASNLTLGLSVVADGLNPVAASRAGWRRAAASGGGLLVDIELACSDPAEHRRRVESRPADIVGLRLPTWAEVQAQLYEPHAGEVLRLDTSGPSMPQLVAACIAFIEGRRGPPGAAPAPAA